MTFDVIKAGRGFSGRKAPFCGTTPSNFILKAQLCSRHKVRTPLFIRSGEEKMECRDLSVFNVDKFKMKNATGHSSCVTITAMAHDHKTARNLNSVEVGVELTDVRQYCY